MFFFLCASGAERWNMISCLCQCYVWFIQSLSSCRSLRNFVEPQQSMEKGKPISSSFIWSYLGCPTDPQSWKQKTSNDSNESNENVLSPKQLQIRPHCWRCMLNNSQMLEGLKICLWVMCVCSNLSYNMHKNKLCAGPEMYWRSEVGEVCQLPFLWFSRVFLTSYQ